MPEGRPHVHLSAEQLELIRTHMPRAAPSPAFDDQASALFGLDVFEPGAGHRPGDPAGDAGVIDTREVALGVTKLEDFLRSLLPEVRHA